MKEILNGQNGRSTRKNMGNACPFSSSGWIFVVIDSVRDEYKLVDIFNKDGEYLAQFETDISTDWLSFNNGKAYAVAAIDEYKFITRYNFEILGYRDN